MPSVEVVIIIEPKVSPANGNEVVSTRTYVERCWSEAKDCIIGTTTTTTMVVPTKVFTKAPSPKVGA